MNVRRIWPCLFGLRCARVEVTHDPFPGLTVVTEYTCDNCGTRYRGNGWKREKVTS